MIMTSTMMLNRHIVTDLQSLPIVARQQADSALTPSSVCEGARMDKSKQLVRMHMRTFLLLCSAFLIFSCNTSSSTQEGNSSQVTAPIINLDLQPGDNNPRNSEGDFVTLKDGTVMFVYSK